MELVRQINILVNKKMTEHETLLKNMGIRGEFAGQSNDDDGLPQLKGSSSHSKEFKAKKEKNLMEYIDISIKNTFHELKNDLESEKSSNNYRI